ncbi:uncharacterized protein LOC106646195 [Copidosoma floridanum]|uniref:uncharacterized protein LOC106646195 n=1 Tax=Copidosoma floridanum TaxID=29053 RepID=UPI000C6F5F9B|nr:uncharacterized protein LOC106646195 [Copidosoma floridanum]
MELEPIIKNETVDSLEGEECEIDYNVQRSFTDNENLIMESPVHDITNGNEECEQNFPSNSIHHKKLSNRRWVVRRRRAKFLRGCFKCGKKYKRFIMLRNHEIKCKVESQDYECAMCPYTTKDQSIFKQHLGNHILGNSNEMILGNVNSSQTDLKTKIKTEDNSGWGFIRLSRCPKCNWCNSDNNDNDKHVNDGDKLDRCSKCFTNLLIYQSTPTCAEYCKDEGYSACQDKIPYVRLTRLPFTCPDSVPLPSPPPLLRFPNSVLSNCEPPFLPPSTELLSKSNKVTESEQKSYSINQSSTTKLQSLVSESIIYQEDCSYAESDVELVKTEEFPTQLSVTDKTDECGDVAKVIENDIDNYRDNNFDVTNIDDLSCQKRRRTLKSSEWIQWFCQKCDAIQSSENFEVGWENQICKKCKAKLLYMCLKCDGKFSTYYTISYHLRYCCAQTEKKTRKRSNKSCSSNTLGSVHVQNHTNSKKVKCMSCDKVFSTQMYLNRHKSVCSKRKDDVQDTLSPNQNSPQTSHKGFIHVSCDQKIPVFTVNQVTPTT